MHCLNIDIPIVWLVGQAEHNVIVERVPNNNIMTLLEIVHILTPRVLSTKTLIIYNVYNNE